MFSELKKSLEKYFKTEFTAFEYQRDFVLYLSSKDDLDLNSYTFGKNGHNFASESLLDLSYLAPVVVIDNAQLDADDSLSDEVTNNNRLTSHFFHRDVISTSPLNEHTITAFNKPKGICRNAPTYFAREKNVRDVIQTIMMKFKHSADPHERGLADDLSNYQYSLMDGDSYHAINKKFGQNFTQEIYDAVGDSQKYAVTWPKDVSRVVLHLNMTDILHGRPYGSDTMQSVLATDLYMPE